MRYRHRAVTVACPVPSMPSRPGPEPRERDCTVPYDDVFFAGTPDDDDREGSAEADLRP